MKFKIRNFNWLAGRPVVFLNPNSANRIDIHVDERVSIEKINGKKKVYAVVDILPKIVKDNEIGLSNEIIAMLNLRGQKYVDVGSAQISRAGSLIKKKISGGKLNKEEMTDLIREIVNNNLTETELAFFAAAEKTKGMNMKEIVFLTEAMVKTGKRLKFNKKIVADKHCIGGIAGNRTTPIVVAICASAGLTIPKTSSRAITSAAGTADVIETISRVDFEADELEKIVSKVGACLAWGGALGLAPSDDKIIRVERILNLDVEPQLLASIMSKKIAAGSNHILIDIPYGAGGKMSTKGKAEKLGEKFKELGRYFKIKVKAVYTKGDEPIGNGVGPVLEMLDIIQVLKRSEGYPEDLREKSLFLASELMDLCGIDNSKEKAIQILDSGKAYEKFKEIINMQNKKNNFDYRVRKLKTAKFSHNVIAKGSGKIIEVSNSKINSMCRVLGTPENHGAGIYLYKHVGKVKKGEKIMTLYSEDKDRIREAISFMDELNVLKIV